LLIPKGRSATLSDMSLLQNYFDLPRKPGGDSIKRKDPCGFCESKEAIRLAPVNYWNLSENNLVRCQSCGQMQIDPMLTDKDMSLGCKAWYISQQLGETPESQKKGLLKAFRRGVAFGYFIKRRGIQPKRALEIGAGDGYFSRGLQFVFPEVQISVLDIVGDVLDYLEKTHGFSPINCRPEDLNVAEHGAFDLVMARDVLEHCVQPRKVFENISDILEPGGHLHFLSPNGYEDMWGFYSQYMLSQKPTELLINHVNYFSPKNLRETVLEKHFKILEWFNLDFKGVVKRGVGRAITPEVACPVSTQKSVTQMIEQEKKLEGLLQIHPDEVLSGWWNLFFLKPIFYIFSIFKEIPPFRLNADYGVGRNTFCLAQKSSSTRRVLEATRL
jgi:2-polyprenyl-3-methyl-5-hydroxy-6-metoxy-1,4-benzoquinol methylase